MAIIGIILGWLLSQWQPFKDPASLDVTAKHIGRTIKSDFTIESQDKIQQPKIALPLKSEENQK